MRHVPTLRGLLRLASLAPPHRAGSIANVPGAVGMSSPRMHAACTGHVCERLRDGHGVSPRTHAKLVATTRTCEGCHDDLTLVTPDLTLTYRSQVWGTVHFEKRALTWNAIEAGRFRLALVAQLDPRQAPGGHKQRAGQHRVQILGRIRLGDGGDTPVAGRARCQGRADRHGYRACMGSIRTTQPPSRAHRDVGRSRPHAGLLRGDGGAVTRHHALRVHADVRMQQGRSDDGRRVRIRQVVLSLSQQDARSCEDLDQTLWLRVPNVIRRVPSQTRS